jgi:hypothetical protein
MKSEFGYAMALARQVEPEGTIRIYFSNDLQLWFMNVLPNPHGRASASGNHEDPEACLKLFIASCEKALAGTRAVDPVTRAWGRNMVARSELTAAIKARL